MPSSRKTIDDRTTNASSPHTSRSNLAGTAIKKRERTSYGNNRVAKSYTRTDPSRKRAPNPHTSKQGKTVLAKPTPPKYTPDFQTLRGRTSANTKPSVAPTTTKKPGSTSQKECTEKRLRVHRKAAPKIFLQKLERARWQRMIVLNRTRVDTEAYPCEEIELAGSTGNVYTVIIGLEPKCTCPDNLNGRGNQCKHIVYVLVTVLKAPGDLQYQLAFLSSELREIFAKAPPIPSQVGSADDQSGNRKAVEGECPICYMDLDEAKNKLVWCRAACGNNVHKSCFDQYVASQRGSNVRCVYCRSPWEAEKSELDNMKKGAVEGEDGYLNIAHLTGQSSVRDISTYNPFWIRSRYGMRYY